MKRLLLGCSLVVVVTLIASMQISVAQTVSCPRVYVLSKNLMLDTACAVISCVPCSQDAKLGQKINTAKIKMVFNLTSNFPCDEIVPSASSAPRIPNGSKLTVTVSRIVRFFPVVDSCNSKNAQWGSFFNIGNWTISYKNKIILSGNVFRGTVGTCAHMNGNGRCCNQNHEEVYLEGMGSKWHIRAMGIIQAYYNLSKCTYQEFRGKLDGVISEQ
jgi:hypothetical protein